MTQVANIWGKWQDVPPHLTQMSSVSGYIFDGLAGLKTRSTVALTESFRATHRKSTCQRNIHISSNFHCNTRYNFDNGCINYNVLFQIQFHIFCDSHYLSQRFPVVRECVWRARKRQAQSKVRFITLFSGNNWRKQKPENKPFFSFFRFDKKTKI